MLINFLGTLGAFAALALHRSAKFCCRTVIEFPKRLAQEIDPPEVLFATLILQFSLGETIAFMHIAHQTIDLLLVSIAVWRAI